MRPFKRLKTCLRSLSYLLQGMPRLSDSKITKGQIQEYVGKPDPTILEIGCNDGTHTLWFLEMFESPRVFCFEPDPRAVKRFKEKVGQRPNVNLSEMALSDRMGRVTFYQSGGHRNKMESETMPEGWDQSGSIRKPKRHLTAHPRITFDQSTTVETTTLDAWCDQQGIETIDFVWMDVQGAELDVVRGGEEALSKTRFIYTEYSNKELYEGQLTLKALLKHLDGFKVLSLYPGDVLLMNKQFS